MRAPRRVRQDRYGSHADLAAVEREHVDYRIVVREVPGARVAIIAPHAGGIERGTSRLARALAADNYHLYLFEGLKPKGNFNALHITSRRFDEPRCLDLVSRTHLIVTVHGCVGLDERVYIGGLHESLKQRIAAALLDAGIAAHLDGHNFPATDADNLCNRGRHGAGVQLEFSAGLRRRITQYDHLAAAIRSAFNCVDESPL